MNELVAHLRREADEIRAMGEEHTEPYELARGVYQAVEFAFREFADRLELVLEEAA